MYFTPEGERSGRMVVIDAGRIKAVRTLPDGRTVLAYVFGPGDLFGFLPFMDGGPYPATAIAVDAVEARVMSRAALRRAVRDNPELAFVLLGALGARLREALARLGDHAQKHASARVAAALCLLRPTPRVADATVIIDVPSPLHAFAADLDMTPETFSRAVSKLVSGGVLHRLANGRLQVLDAARLAHVAAGRA